MNIRMKLFRLVTLMLWMSEGSVLAFSPWTWREWCPRSYSQWEAVAQSGEIPVTDTPRGKLHLNVVHHSDLTLSGYRPSQQYDLELKLSSDHPGGPPHFLLIAVTDDTCGIGTFFTDNITSHVRQTFCTHSIENTTRHHITVQWRAPQCGCISLMFGAMTELGLMLGEHMGDQGLRVCPGQADVNNQLERIAKPLQQELRDILDMKAYGFGEIEEFEDFQEDLETANEIFEMDTDDSFLTGRDAASDHETLQSDEPTRPCKRRFGCIHRRSQHPRKIKRKASLITKRRRSRPQPVSVVGGGTKQQQPEPSKLCTVLSHALSVRQEATQDLGHKSAGWIDRWRDWQTSVHTCCQEEDEEEVVGCIHTVSPIPVPWRKQSGSTENKHLELLCHKVSEQQWTDVQKPKKYYKAPESDKLELEAIWTERLRQINQCCQQNDVVERLACIQNVRKTRIDNICSSDYKSETVPGNIFKKRWLIRKCCPEDEAERYNCFKSSSRKTKHIRKSRKWLLKKKLLDDTSLFSYNLQGRNQRMRRRCCEQGRSAATNAMLLHHQEPDVCDNGEDVYDLDILTSNEKKETCRDIYRSCCLEASRRYL